MVCVMLLLLLWPRHDHYHHHHHLLRKCTLRRRGFLFQRGEIWDGKGGVDLDSTLRGLLLTRYSPPFSREALLDPYSALSEGDDQKFIQRPSKELQNLIKPQRFRCGGAKGASSRPSYLRSPPRVCKARNFLTAIYFVPLQRIVCTYNTQRKERWTKNLQHAASYHSLGICL